MTTKALHPETIHPSLWRASQLARGLPAGLDTGHAALTTQLPGGGWPTGCLIELLLSRPGMGELRLLLPMLRRFAALSTDNPPGRPASARRSILLIRPPYRLQPLALSWWGVDPNRILVLQSPHMADACWAARQALLTGTCDIVLLWQTPHLQGRYPATLQPDALRRLNLAAQAGSALFFMLRPSSEACQPSPAPLRLGLNPAHDGIHVSILKRRGPPGDGPIFVPLAPSPILFDHHVRLDRLPSAANHHAATFTSSHHDDAPSMPGAAVRPFVRRPLHS